MPQRAIRCRLSRLRAVGEDLLIALLSPIPTNLVPCLFATGLMLLPARTEAQNESEADSINQRGITVFKEGEYESSAKLFAEALARGEKEWGEQDPKIVAIINNLAMANSSLGRLEENEALYRRALGIVVTQSGKSDPHVVRAEENLAWTLYHRQKNSEAERLFESVLEVEAARLGAFHGELAGLIKGVASAEFRQNKFEESLISHKRLLENQKKNLGQDHEDVATTMQSVGFVYTKLGRYTDAAPLYERAVEIRRFRLGDVSSTAITLNNFAIVLEKLNREDEAAALYEQAIAILEKEKGADALEVATGLANLALFHSKRRNFEQSRKLLERALSIRKIKLGEDHETTVGTLSMLGTIFSNHGEYEKAKAIFESVLSITEGAYEEGDRRIGEALLKLSNVMRTLAQHDEAERLLLRSVEIAESKFGADSEEFSVALKNLGETHGALGNYSEAGQLLEQALQIREKLFGIESIKLAANLYSISELHFRQGNHETSMKSADRALRLFEDEGWDNLLYARIQMIIGKNYAAQGSYFKAEPILAQRLRQVEDTYGPEHPVTNAALKELANVYFVRGNSARAKPILEQALANDQTSFGSRHPATARSMASLARCYAVEEDFDRAEALLIRAAEIYRALEGGGAARADSLRDLGDVYIMSNRFEEAAAVLEQGLEIMTELDMENTSKANSIRNLMAVSLVHEERTGAALVLARESQRIEKENLFRALSYLPERDCVAMAKKSGLVNLAGSLGDPDLAARQQLWFKGIVQDAITRRRLAEFKLGESEAGRELASTRAELARRYRSVVLEDGESSARAQKLSNRLEQIEQQIAGMLGEAGKAQLIDAGMEEVRAALKKNEVLVESFRYNHLAEYQEWKPNYSSVVIPPSGAIAYLSHNQAKQFESAITRYREALMPSDGNRTESERNDSLQAAETILHEVYLKPLEAQLEGTKTVIFSLDSHLHFLPIHMIRDKNGVPFGRKFDVRYIASGRDLLKSSNRSDSQGAALILGNPTFRDNAPLIELAEAEDAEAVDQAKLEESGATRNARAISLAPLPGTARETAILKNMFEGKGLQVKSLTQGDATEQAFTEGVVGSDIVHVATHGFFFDSELKGIGAMIQIGANEIPTVSSLVQNGPAAVQGDLKPEDKIIAIGDSDDGLVGVIGKPLSEVVNLIRGPVGTTVILEVQNDLEESSSETKLVRITRKAVTIVNERVSAASMLGAMYRSGLALTGAQSTFNLWRKGEVPPPSRDGVLLAAEANLLNLNGTDLVVLSACETAVGESLDGEGIMGLRRAFLSAGANNTLMTLWPVDDHSTVEIMEVFYRKYLSGTPPSKAIIEVQNEFLDSYVERYGEAEALSRLAPFVCMSIGTTK